MAGFDASAGWLAVLKVRGQPKRPVGLGDEIDLTAPGIEKLRLTPKEIRNGEVVVSRQDFSILEGYLSLFNSLLCVIGTHDPFVF